MAWSKDYQSKRVYAWEKEVWELINCSTTLHSTPYMTSLMDEIKELYEEAGILMTAVDFSIGDPKEMDKLNAVGLAHGTYLIEIRPDGMFDQVMIHEMSHIILNNIAPRNRVGLEAWTDHGSIFVGINMCLLKWRYELDSTSLALMEELAEDYAVDYRPWYQCTPRGLRRKQNA